MSNLNTELNGDAIKKRLHSMNSFVRISRRQSMTILQNELTAFLGYESIVLKATGPAIVVTVPTHAVWIPNTESWN